MVGVGDNLRPLVEGGGGGGPAQEKYAWVLSEEWQNARRSRSWCWVSLRHTKRLRLPGCSAGGRDALEV